ncbi:MAG: hypothetical protein RSD47_00755 [Romboutsia sp.]
MTKDELIKGIRMDLEKNNKLIGDLEVIKCLSIKEIKRIKNNYLYGYMDSMDIAVFKGRNKDILEVYNVDNEIDFNLMTFKEYCKLYDDEERNNNFEEEYKSILEQYYN